MSTTAEYIAVTSTFPGGWGSGGTRHCAEPESGKPDRYHPELTKYRSLCGQTLLHQWGNRLWNDVHPVERCRTCERIVSVRARHEETCS